jgi:hypothetical protein
MRRPIQEFMRSNSQDFDVINTGKFSVDGDVV